MEDARRADAQARLDVGDQLAISKAAKRMHADIEGMVNKRTEELLRATAEPISMDEAEKEAAKTKAPLMYYVPLGESDRGLPGIVCTCGLDRYHARFKVLRAWADKHRNKTGHLFGEKPKD
jgi:hypothetical protein